MKNTDSVSSERTLPSDVANHAMQGAPGLKFLVVFEDQERG